MGMCVQMCPARAWGVDIHLLFHGAFIEHLRCVRPILDMVLKEKWPLGRGKMRCGGGLIKYQRQE